MCTYIYVHIHKPIAVYIQHVCSHVYTCNRKFTFTCVYIIFPRTHKYRKYLRCVRINTNINVCLHILMVLSRAHTNRKKANGKYNQSLKNPTWGVYELFRKIGRKRNTYICIYVFTYVYTNLYIHMYTQIFIYIYIYIHIYICIHFYLHSYMCIHV